MPRGLPFALLVGLAAACARQSSPSERAANTPHQVSIVGCVERNRSGIVIRGRDVSGTVQAALGRERGAVPTTQTMGGGDEERNARPHVTIEARASMLTPRLEAGNGIELERHIGERVLVQGEFEPAGLRHADDTVTVQSIETVSPSCHQS